MDGMMDREGSKVRKRWKSEAEKDKMGGKVREKVGDCTSTIRRGYGRQTEGMIRMGKDIHPLYLSPADLGAVWPCSFLRFVPHCPSLDQGREGEGVNGGMDGRQRKGMIRMG